jgi:O-antigen ligase
MFRYLLRQRSLLPHATALGIVLAASATLLWIHAADIAEMLGRDLTLSGRTALWFAVIAFAIQRPLFGYGYAAFWRGMDGDSAYISLALHWDVPHAHNGWLDVGLDLGLLGIVLVGAYFAVVAARAFRAARERRGGAEVWPLLAVTLVFMANLTESSLLRANNLTWVILVLAGAQAVAVRVPVGDGALVPLPEPV